MRITFVSEDSELPGPTYDPGSRKYKKKPRIEAYVPSKEMPFYHEFVRTNAQIIIKLDSNNPRGVSLETTVNK